MKKLSIILLVAGVALAAAPTKAVQTKEAKVCGPWQPVDPNDPNSAVTRYCETTDRWGCSTTQETASCAYGCPVSSTYIGNHCVGLPE